MLSCDVQWCVLQHLSLLIDVLALADEYSNKIKVTKLASAPHMIKRLLASVAFAEVEGKFILGRAHFSQNIIVGFPLEQCVANPGMAIVRCIVQWCPLAMILGIDRRS